VCVCVCRDAEMHVVDDEVVVGLSTTAAAAAAAVCQSRSTTRIQS